MTEHEKKALAVIDNAIDNIRIEMLRIEGQRKLLDKLLTERSNAESGITHETDHQL